MRSNICVSDPHEAISRDKRKQKPRKETDTDFGNLFDRLCPCWGSESNKGVEQCRHGNKAYMRYLQGIEKLGKTRRFTIEDLTLG